tara:strand:- start:385 stop:654 length:270 start_codon:yes stop_codon:yes gene_type:complete
MKNMLPKGFSTFLKNPDMPKLACVVVAIFLAVLILRYFKVIEGMVSDLGVGEGFGGGGKGGGGGHSDKPLKETMPSSSDLMEKLGMAIK